MAPLVVSNSPLTYFKGKRVFITGHTGFKGSWLMACLHLAGATVKGYALAPLYAKGLFDALKPMNLGESVLADIRDKNKLREAIESFHPDFIFHLAAQPIVRRSYEIPAETFEINVVGTANLLETVKDLQGPCTVVVITTDKVYDNIEKNVFYKEEDRLGGFDPYSASKACCELVVNSFRQAFFNTTNHDRHQKSIASARAGNVIGGGDRSPDRIIPDIIRSLEEAKPIEVRNPNAIRPWQHVLEPIAGYLQLAASLHQHPTLYSKAYNFGPLPGDHLTVKQLVEIAIEEWGGGSWKDISNKEDPHEAGILQLDITKAEKELNWKPKQDARSAIQSTIQWYKQGPGNQAEFTIQQIKNYFTL